MCFTQVLKIDEGSLMAKSKQAARQIAIAKIGWCVGYNGDPVQGQSAYILTHKDAHERFAFRKGPSGRYRSIRSQRCSVIELTSGSAPFARARS